MTHRKPSEELVDNLLHDHRDLSSEIMDLRNKRQSVEHKLKRQLLKNGDVNLLNINWSRVNRQYR